MLTAAELIWTLDKSYLSFSLGDLTVNTHHLTLRHIAHTGSVLVHFYYGGFHPASLWATAEDRLGCFLLYRSVVDYLYAIRGNIVWSVQLMLSWFCGCWYVQCSTCSLVQYSTCSALHTLQCVSCSQGSEISFARGLQRSFYLSINHYSHTQFLPVTILCANSQAMNVTVVLTVIFTLFTLSMATSVQDFEFRRIYRSEFPLIQKTITMMSICNT